MKKITSFKFQTGSYFGSHERIEFKKGKLTYTYSNYPFHFIDNPPNVIERVIDENELEPLIAMLPMFQIGKKTIMILRYVTDSAGRYTFVADENTLFVLVTALIHQISIECVTFSKS
jgi:hypothetical protein